MLVRNKKWRENTAPFALANSLLSWFEKAQVRLLTMRITYYPRLPSALSARWSIGSTITRVPTLTRE
jgi:hypothetical protein